MKKLLFFFLVTLTFISCEDIETNDVALQANIDNRFYASADTRAAINPDSTLTIQGFTKEEALTLQLSNLAEGNFRIGNGSRNYGIFEDFGGNVYTSRPNGEGMVTISEINQTNKTITGTFHFNAFLAGIDTLYVSNGVLHNVSYANGNIGDPTNAGTFSAKVNGNDFTPISVSTRDTGNTIIISGAAANSSIIISVPVSVELGEYTLPRGGFSAKYQNANGPETTEAGTISVLEHNRQERTIKGAFSFLTNRSEITVGAFNVTY